MPRYNGFIYEYVGAPAYCWCAEKEDDPAITLECFEDGDIVREIDGWWDLQAQAAEEAEYEDAGQVAA